MNIKPNSPAPLVTMIVSVIGLTSFACVSAHERCVVRQNTTSDAQRADDFREFAPGLPGDPATIDWSQTLISSRDAAQAVANL